MIHYPLLVDLELPAELQSIHFARISPADAEETQPNPGPDAKLAGKVLAHFGGFLNATWRGNDLTWGRLDAAEIILRELLPGDDWKNHRDEFLRDLHTEIIEDMRTRGMGIYSPLASADFEDLIGKQSLSDIPLSLKARWSMRSLLSTVKILRKSVSDMKPNVLVNGFVIGVDYVINVLIWAAILAPWLLGNKPRRRFLGLVVATGVVYLLWWHSLREWWTLLNPF